MTLGSWGASRGRALRLWLCPVLSACCFVLFGASSAYGASAAHGASAAPLRAAGAPEEPAPMCDPAGASVAAREDIPEIDRGHFEALPCDAQLMFSSWRLDAPELGCQAMSFSDREPPVPHPTPSPRVRHEAVSELSVPFPARTEPMLVALSMRQGLAPRRGQGRPPFRPPDARG
jgi:hypothetical protein